MPDGSTSAETILDVDAVDFHVGRAIRARRRALGITQEAVAAEIALTFQQVQKYERGHNRVSASKLYAIARFLRCHPGDFFPPVAVRRADGANDVPDDPLLILAGETGGPELAALYPRLSRRGRAALLHVAQALLGGEP